MTLQAEEIMEKLNHIQLDLEFIKGHLSDVDLILTDDDGDALQEAEEELKKGKTRRML